MYPILHGLKLERYTSVLDLLANTVVIVAMTISAENVQLKANKIRVSFMTVASRDKSAMANGKWVKILEDRDALTLTAWGMFAMRKPILLSMISWPFTYGLIFVQFFDKN
ncbi:hypothetical protein CDAR_268331 [Caerostris darwini]|uniref:Uncharacterized protein n=1 Tax=Caerostris darwini TaxID=1538125 RepID=A0AAV4N033_9ARAC|nr:hypothetical protein CDAR_268331 [Caerostris darwini]